MDGKTSQIDFLGKMLDVASLRHNVIAQNIANVNTPLYRQREVSFEDALAKKLQAGDLQEVLHLQPKVVEGAGGTTRLDGNNVDIDQELTALTKNTLLFNTLTQILATKIGNLRSAIRGS